MATISVITAAFNKSKYISACVESVFDQSLPPDEHIIIDDSSTDTTYELVTEISKKNPKIVAIRNPKNLGYPATLNIAVRLAKSEFIAILDADDISMDNWLLSCHEIISSNPKFGVVGGGGIIATANAIATGKKICCDAAGDVTDLVKQGLYPILHGGALIRKSALLEIGGYNVNLKSMEDNDMFLGISSIAKIFSIGKPLIYYRRLPGSESRKSEAFLSLVKQYCTEKAFLLANGHNVLAANQSLQPLISKISTTDRLERTNKTTYYFEMGASFEEGKNYNKALAYYFRSLLARSEIYPSLKGVLKCILPEAIVALIKNRE